MSKKLPLGLIALMLASCDAGSTSANSPVATGAAALVTPLVSASQANPPGNPSVAAWRKQMRQKHLPKKGCFRASPPDSSWTEVPCQAGPQVPHSPTAVAVAAPGATIAFAQGNFPSVTGVTSEYDSLTGYSDNFSLQLNTNLFSSSACSGATSPYCTAWQQFIYDNNYSNAGISATYMQYWLIHYNTDNTTCPSGWNNYLDDCWKNSSESVWYSYLTSSDLSAETLEAQASPGGSDEVFFYHSSGYYATASDSVLDLAYGWTSADFNVLGFANGSDAIFNSGATITVQTSVDDSLIASPNWNWLSETGESSNLSVVSDSVCPAAGTAAYPSLTFIESNTTAFVPFCLQDHTVPARLPLF
jgi:hypothetical protein